jgi:ATP:ADP antiporter, AAA family
VVGRFPEPSESDRSEAAPRAYERLLARALRPFGQVEPREGLTAAVMALTVFLLLSAYYLLKTAREPLILLQGGAEVKSYASAGQSLLLLVVVRGYAELAKRVGRMKLVAIVYLFFASNLVLFWLLSRLEVPLGIPFYLWVGIFSVTAIAQFWSFANDIYKPEQGKRLFGILGIGSSLGAVVGAWIAKQLASLGPYTLMLSAAGVLVVCVSLFLVVERHVDGDARRDKTVREDAPVSQEGLIPLLLHSKYLLLLGVFTLLLNCVNSNGEYLIDRTLLETVKARGLSEAAATTFIGEFKGDFFGWVNLVGVVLQLFAVSRILQYIGVRRALFVLPVVASLSYAAFIIQPVLSVLRFGKIAENSLDYSLQNTARQALFLVTSRAEKYVGKNVVDTLIVRLGDVASAGLVFMASRLELPTQGLAVLNLILIGAWLGVLILIGREHRRREAQAAEGEIGVQHGAEPVLRQETVA